jgi:septal ring factor EnvC (AmiA/AmiB activator)
VETLKTVDEKIAYAIDKVKALKEEKSGFEKRLASLEETVKAKDREIEKLLAEKASIKTQIEDLLKELESIQLK